MPAYVVINVLTQLTMAIFWGLMLGTTDFLHDVSIALSKADYHTVSAMVGGFLLGHGDHIGSIAMQRLPASHAYMIYAGFTTATGTLLNELIEPVASPSRLVSGVVLVFLGILALGLRVVVEEGKKLDEALLDVPDLGETEAARRVTSVSAGQLQGVAAEGGSEQAREDEQHRVRRQAIWLCVIAALCATGWSPLSTLAAQRDDDNSTSFPNGWEAHSEQVTTSLADPFAFIVLFVAGETLCMPSVIAIGSYIEGISPRAAWRDATPTRVAWGVATGIVINLGYVGFFMATSLGPDVLPHTSAFAISTCNPVVGLLASEAWACRATPSQRKCSLHHGLTLCSVTFYLAAIALLTLSAM